MNKTERLQKVLARAGIASRRHAEELITEGRVRVNNRLVTELGVRVDPIHDKVEVDGRRVVAEPLVYELFHKPRGVVTTLHDPEGRPTIADFTRDLGARVFPVGRLDFNTSGALLLTNDGALAQALLHPRNHVPKTYVCKVRGVPSDVQLEPWRQGMVLPPSESDPDEKPTKTMPAEVRVMRHSPSGQGLEGEEAPREEWSTWLHVTLREGRTRQIHRMAEATGLFVMRLARLTFAGLSTEGLRPGKHRTLTDKEITALRVQYLRPVENAAARRDEGTQAPKESREPREPKEPKAPREPKGAGRAVPPRDARAAVSRDARERPAVARPRAARPTAAGAKTRSDARPSGGPRKSFKK